MTFPVDLPDLLRIACSQGAMQMNVWFNGGERGYQANLANSRSGSTVDYDGDCLVAMEKVLRTRYGRMLDRQRAEGRPLTEVEAAAAVHPAHREVSAAAAPPAPVAPVDDFGALL